MPTFQQWVNFPDRDGRIGSVAVTRADFVDGDVPSTSRMGRVVYVRARFRRNESGGVAKLEIIPDGDNARYSLRERSSHAGIFVPSAQRGVRIARDGRARFRVTLPPAGGDKFRFRARNPATGHTVDCDVEIETRRKLFFQLIRMRRARKITAAHARRFEDRFWDTGSKLYLKLEELATGRTIPNLVNFDDTIQSVADRVKRDARGQYDASRAPFSFVVVFVNRNCIQGTENGSQRATNGGGALQIQTNDPLFHYADPSVGYYNRVTWTPDGGPPEVVPRSAITVVDKWTLSIDASALASGPGRLRWSLKVVEIEGMGLSLPTENLCTVASRSLDATVPSREMLNVIVHEVGHKIGMVPGPQGDPDLDRQPKYYDGRGHSGGHCHFGAPLLANYMAAGNPSIDPRCTMFGDTSSDTDRFCRYCLRSVRRLDVSPARKQGLRRQF